MLLYGSIESVLQDIRFENVSIKLMNSTLNNVAGGNIDLRGCLDPHEQLFQSDIPGFFANYVDGLTVNHFGLSWDSTMLQPYFREGIRIQNFNHIRLTDVSSPAAPGNRHNPEIALLNGTAALLENGAEVSLKT